MVDINSTPVLWDNLYLEHYKFNKVLIKYEGEIEPNKPLILAILLLSHKKTDPVNH